MPTIIDPNTGLVIGAVNLMAGALQQLDMTANKDNRLEIK